MAEFWLGVMAALPFYLFLDRVVVPWIVDEPLTRMVRVIRHRGR